LRWFEIVVQLWLILFSHSLPLGGGYPYRSFLHTTVPPPSGELDAKQKKPKLNNNLKQLQTTVPPPSGDLDAKQIH
jgi:hypothetical protein